MYIRTYTNCIGFLAVASKDESENEVIHRFHYVDGALHREWMTASVGSEEEKRIERKGEQLALQKLLDEMVEHKQISVSDALVEMAKFMGGETEAPPEPEPEKPKLAYAVGDEVLVRAKIVGVDEGDDLYPYRVRGEFGEEWVTALDIAGKADRLFPTENVAKEEPEPVKYEVGTKVRSKIRPFGVGTYLLYFKISDDDNVPHEVAFSDGKHWLSDREIEVVEDEPKFKVGDMVIHRFKPEWGVGKVLNGPYSGNDRDFRRYYEEEYEVEGMFYSVNYSHDGNWNTLEQNLVPA